MTNREVARVFNKLAKIMELHGENAFKTRSYSSAYNTIRRYDRDIIALSHDELMSIPGIGKNIADKIGELGTTGTIATLQKYIDMTPPGVVEMLDIKGVGPKKLILIWKELGIETPGELIYACSENRLIELKGFGSKTQENIRAQLEYYLDNKGFYLYGHIENEALELLELLWEELPDHLIDLTGEVRRMMPVVDGIHVLTTASTEEIEGVVERTGNAEEINHEIFYKGTKVLVTEVDEYSFHQANFEGAASDAFINAWRERYGNDVIEVGDEDLFEEKNMAYIPSECRESGAVISMAQQKSSLEIIEVEDIKGVVHAHSKWSDGAATVQQMAEASKELGYDYLVMTDHSQAAFYADGLKPNQVLAQMEEIDALNQVLEGFKVYKGIECDILYDGRLDYEDDFLSKFDVVIASVHSNLKMDQDKAMSRLLKAISHPATRILGHLTGRLLLSRQGYPIDHKEIIDACAAHDVAIELNASPYRLDMDWSWISYAMEQDVMISINPDAHSLGGIKDIRYGVLAARKALLTADMCLNTKNRQDFDTWVKNKRGG